MKRKKGFVIVLSVVFILLFSVITVSANEEIRVCLDGEFLNFDVPPIAQNGRTLVPMRVIFEKLGATVQWDQITQTARATRENLTVSITIGDTNMRRFDSSTNTTENYTLDVPAMAINGRTLIPLRAVSEAFLCQVEWNGDNRTVSIISSEKVPDNNTPTTLKVMSYNVGTWYNGSGKIVPDDKYEKFVSLQKNIIDKYKPDILCLQEYHNKFTSNITAQEALLGERYLHNSWANPTGNIYSGKAICSDLKLSDAKTVSYSTSLDRSYRKAYITINGRKVCIVNAHWSLEDPRAAIEAQELLAFANQEEYIIICGDFNVNLTDKTSAEYINSVKLFVDAGYKLCNDGSHITYPISSAGIPKALDNIIVSSNINIKSVVVDTQKEGLEEGPDHYPIIAALEIE